MLSVPKRRHELLGAMRGAHSPTLDAARFTKQTAQWLSLIESFNQALKAC
jgi:hypothetical protein